MEFSRQKIPDNLYRQKLTQALLPILESLVGYPSQELPFISTPQEASNFFFPEAMDIWVKAFTTPLDNPIESENYEQLEHLGDKISGAVFAEMVINRHPQLGAKDLSEIKNIYMSGIRQTEIAYKLGLDSLIRGGVDPRVESNVVGDIFESFFGALYEVVRITPGYQYRAHTACLAMVYFLFREEEIDLELGLAPAKTRVQQIFQRLVPKVGPEEVTESQLANGYLVKISLNQKQIDLFYNFGVRFKHNIIGSGTGNTQTAAENMAYENALKHLEQNGITPAWADEVKSNHNFRHYEIAKYLDQIVAVIKERGYHKIYFNRLKKFEGKNSWLIQLVAIPQSDLEARIGLGHRRIERTRDSSVELNARVELIKEMIGIKDTP